QPVLTAKTKIITLNKGALQLKASDLSPIQYNYSGSSFNIDRNPDGFLPIGSFVACYSIIKQKSEGSLQLSEECIPIEVTPLSPPLLNTPENDAIIETTHPQFTWLPPTPVNLFSDLNYNLVLVEVMKGQSPSQAVQSNIPVYNIGNYKSLFNNYPTSNKSLDTGRLYAWRVVAKNSNQFTAQSDVWTFRISNRNPSKEGSRIQSFTELKRGYDAAFAICYGSLKFDYNNDANDSTIQYKIISIEDGKGTILKKGTLITVFGQNLFELPLQNVKGFQNNKTYMLQVFNSRDEQWSLNFSYNSSKN
ncbi:MAG TPA: hypothetical protein VF622_02965, partial [Segetibacter sp.]